MTIRLIVCMGFVTQNRNTTERPPTNPGTFSITDVHRLLFWSPKSQQQSSPAMGRTAQLAKTGLSPTLISMFFYQTRMPPKALFMGNLFCETGKWSLNVCLGVIFFFGERSIIKRKCGLKTLPMGNLFC
jgi:hypothetical protein